MTRREARKRMKQLRSESAYADGAVVTAQIEGTHWVSVAIHEGQALWTCNEKPCTASEVLETLTAGPVKTVLTVRWVNMTVDTGGHVLGGQLHDTQFEADREAERSGMVAARLGGKAHRIAWEDKNR